MNWTTADDIRKQVQRRWQRGEILRALVGAESTFPLRLRLSMPSTREMAMEFTRTREWIAMLSGIPGLRVAYRSNRSRALGQQELPEAIWVDHPNDAVALLGVSEEADCFLSLYEATKSCLPELLPWLEANPLKSIALRDSWDRLLRVAAWMKSRPAEQRLYIRQVNLPDIDSKFVEQHTNVLSELFDLVTPSHGLHQAVGADFHGRYGFLREPVRVRFRILDPALRFASIAGTPDIELDEGSFAALQLPLLRRIFVTENKTNFLAFPLVEAAVVVFGKGYGMDAFGRAHWCRTLPLYYWGDIDTHGFAILSELRSVFPHAESFLMDNQTLFHHRTAWTKEASPFKQRPSLLTAEEAGLFEQLRAGVPHEGIRLEQEKISLSWFTNALNGVLGREATHLSGDAVPGGDD